MTGKGLQGCDVRLGNGLPAAMIAGTCQMKSRAHALETPQALQEIAGKRSIALINKTSFEMANLASGDAARGLGMAAALPVFAEIRESPDLAVLTDVHEERAVSSVVKMVGSETRSGRFRYHYFTRAKTSWAEGVLWHRMGLYAWRRAALDRFVSLPPLPLKQLCGLEAGMRTDAVAVDDMLPGVDPSEGLARAREMLAARGHQS